MHRPSSSPRPSRCSARFWARFSDMGADRGSINNSIMGKTPAPDEKNEKRAKFPLKRASAQRSLWAGNPFFTSRVAGCLVFILFFSASMVCGAAQNPGEENPCTFSFYFENDLFFNTDQHYTNGVKLTWISPDLTSYAESEKLPDWSHRYIRMLPFINESGLKRNVAFSIGQAMFTPAHTEREDLIVNDRPYAGWTYLGVAFHSKNDRRLDSMEIQLGLVGPESFAEFTQKEVHTLRGFPISRGWNNQLRNEPGLNFFYARKWRVFDTGLEKGLGFDMLTLMGGALGNIHTYANAGLEMRFGWNIPVDFGDSQIQPASSSNDPVTVGDPRLSASKGYSMYLYTTVGGRAVLRDIFLDGNTFAQSHSVDKNHFVANAAFGFSVIFRRFKLSLAKVICTKEFKGQQDEQRFGSITLSFTY
ncbi:MAG: lipid A deacylase LpxR family protein [Proteobacteria bacterium]|nr:lipid A deacylase LpxR family protein [Pseudomonadota bacterium]MBU2227595.1 lipid A deacylase LpxR family protein [Pseudomonadota bacterium]